MMEATQIHSVALLGFSSGVTAELKDVLCDYNAVSIDYVEIADSLEDYDVKFKKEFDIIILNSMGYKTSVHEVISYIKIIYPLTEFIVVSFTPSFSMAIHAFRAGARDFVEYPFVDVELKSSLERAISYRSVFQLSESMGNIIGMLGIVDNYRQFKSLEEFFRKLRSYLIEKYYVENFKMVRYDKSGAYLCKIDPDDEEQVLPTEDHLYEFVRKCADPNNPSRMRLNWEQMENFSVMVTFNLGVKDRQEYWCTFHLNEFVAQELSLKYVDYFIKFMRNAFYYQLNREKVEMMESLAHTDDVTGLFNQRRLAVDIQKLTKQYEKDKQPFSMVFLDIDNFKSVNDNHGHLIGSLLLVELSKVLKKAVRETDYLYRYGGDEFVIIFPSATTDDVFPIAERLLEAVLKQTFLRRAEQTYKLSVSIGVAEYPRDADSKEEVIIMADKMMYEAKKAGKGRICLARDFIGPQSDAE